MIIDWISIGSMHASVTEIRRRITILTTFDNETVVIPNQQMSQVYPVESACQRFEIAPYVYV